MSALRSVMSAEVTLRPSFVCNMINEVIKVVMNNGL